MSQSKISAIMSNCRLRVSSQFLTMAVIWWVSVFCYIHRIRAEDAVPELNRLIADLPADGSVLELAQGTYTIGSTWTISRTGLTIRGAGMGKTVFVRSDSFRGLLINLNGEASTITDLTIDGNCPGVGQKTGAELALHQRNQVADMVEVKNFCHIGIAVPASGCRVTRCVITGLGNPAIPSVGIWHDAGKESTDAMITVDHNAVRNNGINGIYCTGGKIIVTNNQLFGNHCQTIPNGGGQIDIGSARTTNTDATITDNTVMNGGGVRAGGIELGGGKFFVARNTIRNHGIGGTGIARNAKTTMIDNIISNSGQYTVHPNRAGITAQAGATGFKLIGNRVFDDQPVKTQTWGIRIMPGCDQYEVRNNDVRGNLYPKGLLDESHARARAIAANVPPEANR
jgi:hypothetical protein